MFDTPSPNPLIVDFFGSPGSGKTHISSLVAEHLRARGISTLVLRERLFPKRFTREWFASRFGTLLWMVLHPIHTWQLRCAIAASQQQLLADRKRFRLAWIRTCERVSRLKSNHRIVLVDHGLAQLVWAIGYGANRSVWSGVIKRFAPLMTLADLTIVVDVSSATAMTRLRRRGQHQGKTSRLEQEDLSNEEVLANVEELERQVIDLLNTVADANCRLVRFNNDHEQQDGEAIGRLANAIELLLKNAEDCPAKFVSTYLTESTSKITIE